VFRTASASISRSSALVFAGWRGSNFRKVIREIMLVRDGRQLRIKQNGAGVAPQREVLEARANIEFTQDG
jgi:hypothetical protein